MSKIYCPLNLPAFVPTNITDDIETCFYDSTGFGKPAPGTCRYINWLLSSDALDQYISNNIPELAPHIVKTEYQEISNHDNYPAGAKLNEHSDGSNRRFVIQYNIDTGGPVYTRWWQEMGYPLYRNFGNTPNSVIWYNGKQLETVAEYMQPAATWTMFRTDVIHSVENIMSLRKSIIATFDNEDLFQLIIEKYGC
jgi:hypothetical protein